MTQVQQVGQWYCRGCQSWRFSTMNCGRDECLIPEVTSPTNDRVVETLTQIATELRAWDGLNPYTRHLDWASRLESLRSLVSQQQEWRDIQTAPKDGTYILIGWFGVERPRPMVAMWHLHLKAWAWTHGHLRKDAAPTHWMPLPAFPQAVQQTDEAGGS